MKMSVTTGSAVQPSGDLLTWDTEFWSMRLARANTRDPELLDAWAKDNTIGCMALLIPMWDQDDIHRAEANGFRVMDVRVTYTADITVEAGAIVDVDRATDRDRGDLERISRTSFRGLTRFYADPRFPDDRCDDLYQNWIKDSMDGWAAAVIVVREPDHHVPVGFVTVHRVEHVASIGLIAVDADYRGHRIGSTLVQHAAYVAGKEYGCTTMKVVTQVCNIVAQNTFQRNGMVIEDAAVWLHKWYDQ